MTCSLTLPPYIVQELPDISNVINEPLKSAQRIKYTCFDVSRTYIAFGATSGGVYMFNRCPCDFIQLIPSKDGAITRLSISPDEKRVAVATGHGTVHVVSCQQLLVGARQAVTSKEHCGNEVTTMVWGNNLLFTGDDVGKVSVLQMSALITSSIFQSSSQTIMSLDSRICQMDVRDCMLVVSTLTRCYVCDTSKEQYRQIGQKLREGEFGVCFVTTNPTGNGASSNGRDLIELKKYNIVDGELTFSVHERFSNTLIYSARPSSRLWEATMDGTVRRTHQYKQVLARASSQVVALASYVNENVKLVHSNQETEGVSCSFTKLYCLDGAIFSFRRDALYFLNTNNVEHTLWCDDYNNIVDCRVVCNRVYVWRQDGSIVTLHYSTIEEFLVKCFIDAKYVLCSELCLPFKDHLLSDECIYNLSILVGLREKLSDELLSNIQTILDKFEKSKVKESTKLKSGIYVVDNAYKTQSMHDDPGCNKHIAHPKLKMFGNEGNSSTQNEDAPFEKSLQRLNVSVNESIVYKEPCHSTVTVDDSAVKVEVTCKLLYQLYTASATSKGVNESDLLATTESYSHDIGQIYELMRSLESYCKSIGAVEESKYAPSSIFLAHISRSKERSEILEAVIKDESLYNYFVESCILINMKSRKLSNVGCECGFPLPYARTNDAPEYSELIDEFIEKQWSSQTELRCYEFCKRMPYLWRKILYLRRNEDLMNILRLLLQMLDETLLHTFLPQFTLETWERVVQLYATLYRNVCLNCNSKFSNVSVRDTLSWDGLGRLLIKSVGGRNAVRLMEKYADLIGTGEITVKFYHSCILAALFQDYDGDGTVVAKLVDTVYASHQYTEARLAICKLLQATSDGRLKNTSLPLVVAAQSDHWGLSPLNITAPKPDLESAGAFEHGKKTLNISMEVILENLPAVNKGIVDCPLCGLPLTNEVLIKDGGLWVFSCGHTFHGACLDLNKVKLCPSCSTN